jgi:nitrate/TMAO reductase-like tetraheme cytochrome c subunit
MDATYNQVMEHIYNSVDAYYKSQLELAKQKFAKEKENDSQNSKRN